jgi:hypothetical protein
VSLRGLLVNSPFTLEFARFTREFAPFTREFAPFTRKIKKTAPHDTGSCLFGFILLALRRLFL